jgi:hypothetical protein
MAATPVRARLTSPRGRINSVKASTFSGVPVISKTKLSSVLSTTLARKISAMRSDSTRFSPLAMTLISASSRLTKAPSTVRSDDLVHGDHALQLHLDLLDHLRCAGLVTMVMRERCPW